MENIKENNKVSLEKTEKELKTIKKQSNLRSKYLNLVEEELEKNDLINFANNEKIKELETKIERNKSKDKIFKYDDIKLYLDLNFKSIVVTDTLRKESKIYYDDSNNVVSFIDNNVITLYFEFDSNVIWNHNGRVMVGIIKDMPIINNYKGRLCDVAFYSGMCGAVTHYETDFLFDSFVKRASKSGSYDIDNKKLGSIGVYDKGKFIIGNNDITISNIPEFDNPKKYCYGILSENEKYYIHKNNYEMEYNELKEKNSWYWGSGYNTANSDKTRGQIVKLKNGTNYHKINDASIEFSDKIIKQMKSSTISNKNIDILTADEDKIDETLIKEVNKQNAELDKKIDERKRKLELVKEYAKLAKIHNKKQEELKKIEEKIKKEKESLKALKYENK